MLEVRGNLEFGRRYGENGIFVMALCDVATLASLHPNPAIVEETLRELNDECQAIPLNSKREMSIAFARARLLRRLGRTGEATANLQLAMRIRQEEIDLPDQIPC